MQRSGLVGSFGHATSKQRAGEAPVEMRFSFGAIDAQGQAEKPTAALARGRDMKLSSNSDGPIRPPRLP
jgi:hypothetical protein